MSSQHDGLGLRVHVDTSDEDGDTGGEEPLLIVVLNNTRDWERVRQESWYRIPVSRAPRQVGADYLAFYHTAAFQEERWTVSTYAPVRRVRLRSRRELIPYEGDHPRSSQLYFCVDIGKLEKIEPPLPSRRLRRITFIRTTLQRLFQAQDVTDLWMVEPLRERLWVELNRQGIHAVREAEIELCGIPRCDFYIPCNKGAVVVDCLPSVSQEVSSPREAVSLYPTTERPCELDGTGISWLGFEDIGWEVHLGVYMGQVLREIRRRGGLP